MHYDDNCAGSPADKLPPRKHSEMGEPESKEFDDSPEFRGGGKCRSESQADDDTDPHECASLSESGLFPSPCGSTFATAATEFPPFSPTFDIPAGNLPIDFAQRETVSGGQSIATRSCKISGTSCNPNVPGGITTLRDRSPTNMGSECSFDQTTVFDGETAQTSDWDSCMSSMCPSASVPMSQEPSDLAMGKATRPVLPRRDYRWNVLQQPNQPLF